MTACLIFAGWLAAGLIVAAGFHLAKVHGRREDAAYFAEFGITRDAYQAWWHR